MGVTDDLATRLAYESLTSLSGMASKVQETIEHNRRAFANQVATIDKQVMQKALYVWKTYVAGRRAKRRRAARARTRVLRGLLSRAFAVWQDRRQVKDRSHLMRRKVRDRGRRQRSQLQRWRPCLRRATRAAASGSDGAVGSQVQATIARGAMGRAFHEWRGLANDRWWKKQLLFREREIELLEKLCQGFRQRPLVVLRKRRVLQCMRAWAAQAARLRRKRLRLQRADRAFRFGRLAAVWAAWLGHCDVRPARTLRPTIVPASSPRPCSRSSHAHVWCSARLHLSAAAPRRSLVTTCQGHVKQQPARVCSTRDGSRRRSGVWCAG